MVISFSPTFCTVLHVPDVYSKGPELYNCPILRKSHDVMDTRRTFHGGKKRVTVDSASTAHLPLSSTGREYEDLELFLSHQPPDPAYES